MHYSIKTCIWITALYAKRKPECQDWDKQSHKEENAFRRTSLTYKNNNPDKQQVNDYDVIYQGYYFFCNTTFN